MNIPAPTRTSCNTEWKDGNGLQMTVIVSRHDRSTLYSADYRFGCHIEFLQGNFWTLEDAWRAAVNARAAYEAEEAKNTEVRDRAFAATVGMMLTSTGEWVSSEEWDDIEGMM
jgi:hypothetical protein